MHIDYLVRMANDIGAFFAAESDKAEATQSILLHIKRFWDPRMRSQIIAHYQATGGAGLADPVLAAVGLLAAEKKSEQNAKNA